MNKFVEWKKKLQNLELSKKMGKKPHKEIYKDNPKSTISKNK